MSKNESGDDVRLWFATLESAAPLDLDARTAAGLLMGDFDYALFFAVPMVGLLVLSFWRTKGFDLVADFSLVN